MSELKQTTSLDWLVRVHVEVLPVFGETLLPI